MSSIAPERIGRAFLTARVYRLAKSFLPPEKPAFLNILNSAHGGVSQMAARRYYIMFTLLPMRKTARADIASLALRLNR
jgi:hypothetical protein